VGVASPSLVLAPPLLVRAFVRVRSRCSGPSSTGCSKLFRQLRLYPIPASWLFDRQLHFVAQLTKRSRGSLNPTGSVQCNRETSMSIELSIVMPCLNVAETLERCIIGGLDPEAAKYLGSLARGDRSRADHSRHLKLPPDRANQAFRVAVLPWRAWRNRPIPNAHGTPSTRLTWGRNFFWRFPGAAPALATRPLRS
jgi:hypothetical protein